MEELLSILSDTLCGKDKIDDEIRKMMSTTDFSPLVNCKKFKKGTYVKDKLIEECGYSLYCVYWASDSYSSPHNHPLGGCILKIIKGSIKETEFKLVGKKAVYQNDHVLTNGDIGVKYGNELHSMKPIDNTVSVHIYFPGDYCPTFFKQQKD